MVECVEELNPELEQVAVSGDACSLEEANVPLMPAGSLQDIAARVSEPLGIRSAEVGSHKMGCLEPFVN